MIIKKAVPIFCATFFACSAMAQDTAAPTAPSVSEPESIASPDQIAALQDQMQKTVELLVDMQVTVFELRSSLPELRRDLRLVKQQLAQVNAALTLICGEAIHAESPECMPATPKDSVSQDDLGRVASDVTGLTDAVQILETRLGQLEIEQTRPAPVAPQPDNPTIDDSGSDDVQPTVVPSEEQEPFTILRNEAGRIIFPRRRDVDVDVLTLPAAQTCADAGTWLDAGENDLLDRALFVNANGVVRVCKFVAGSWGDFSAGRNDRAHVVIEAQRNDEQ